jgi:hypothetical protein
VIEIQKKKQDDHGTGIPRHEIEALAQSLFPDILAFFDTEQGRREFEEWERKQTAKKE